MAATFQLPVGLPPLPPELAALAGAPVGVEANPDEIVRQAFRIGHMRLPANLLGLVNLHGRIVPLFDLAALFETQHLAQEKRMLLVIGHGNDAAGIVIDGLPRRMVFLPEARIVAPELPGAAAAAVRATYTAGKDAWFEFDYAQLLLYVS
jgi:chemotaxis signal transduction protein